MDALTVAEALELIRINEEAMALQFQTWLTVTFATIVAVFAGRSLLTSTIKWLITILYLLASLSLVAMSLYLAESSVRLIDSLAARGADVVSPLFAGVVFLLLFVAGVSTTVYFIHMKHRENPS